jgi:hypothetical protein
MEAKSRKGWGSCPVQICDRSSIDPFIYAVSDIYRDENEEAQIGCRGNSHELTRLFKKKKERKKENPPHSRLSTA